MAKSGEMSGGEIFGITVAAPMLCAFCAIFNGWVLSLLWQWIVTPTFGMKAITVAQAVGLFFVINYVKNNIDINKKKEEDPMTFWFAAFLTIFCTLLNGFVVLFLAWLVTLFM
jgi:hypothetical protein